MATKKNSSARPASTRPYTRYSEGTLADVVSAAAAAGEVRCSDLEATLPYAVLYDADAVISWACDYGRDAAATAAMRHISHTTSVRIAVEDMGRAYTAAVTWILLVARRRYNRGETFELAAAIATGRFPKYGIANNRSALGGEPDLRFENGTSASAKRVDVGATFKATDNADMLLAGFGNVPFFFLLNKADWADFEDTFLKVDTSRGAKRSPKSKKAAAKMIAWMNERTA